MAIECQVQCDFLDHVQLDTRIQVPGDDGSHNPKEDAAARIRLSKLAPMPAEEAEREESRSGSKISPIPVDTASRHPDN